ncbi:MAG: ChbG/HpnK family deacetylase [Hyphomicrobiales bacterium]|nr:ChbG/HpnK family deacetylase [Hyphomicrobiales bacterium]
MAGTSVSEGRARSEGEAARALRRIWLCADDYGISPAVSGAIRELIEQRRINATSVMVAAPSFHRSEAAALAQLRAGGARVAIGLHLTLSAPFAPLSAGFTPLSGTTFPDYAALLAYGCLRRLDPAALRAEVVAQIRLFVHAFGYAPDFIDGHQHVHLFPQVRDAVLAATRAHAPHAWVRQCGRSGPLRARLRDPKGLVLDMLSRGLRVRAAALDIHTNPVFAGTYAFAEDADFARIFPRFLDGLPDGGLVMCHPGLVDAELRRLDPLTTLREKEYAYFAAPTFPALLAEHGVSLA